MNPVPNTNETENYLVLAFIAGTSAWAAKHGFDSSTWAALVTTGAPFAIGAGVALYSAVRNFNMKKVSEDAKVVTPITPSTSGGSK